MDTFQQQSTSKGFRKQLPLNLISNIAYFVLNVLVGIWLVPFFIKHLGIEGYGFIPLASSVIVYVGLITISLNGAVSRYLTVDLQKNDTINANKTFNTAFWGLLAIVVILFPLVAVFSYFVPDIFKVPTSLTREVQWLFFCMLVTFLLSIFTSIFNVSAYAYNRLDLRNYGDILNLLARTIFVILFFGVMIPCLKYVGIAYILGAGAALIYSIFLLKKLTPNLKIRIKEFEPANLSILMSMGWWLTINQIGSVLFLKIDLIVANLLFGPARAGEYGAILQWSFLLRSMAGVVAGIFGPMILISYAQNDTSKIISLSQKAVKFMGLGMALPIGLLCGFASPLLNLWLGKDFAKFDILMWLLVSHLIINLAIIPLFSVTTALNRVRFPGIITLVMGVGNLVLAIILPKYCNLGIYGIALAGAIMLTLKNALFTPIYTAHILNISKMTFVKPLSAGIVLTGFVWLSAYLIINNFCISNWGELIGASLMVGIVFIAAVWQICLKKEERLLLLSLINYTNK